MKIRDSNGRANAVAGPSGLPSAANAGPPAAPSASAATDGVPTGLGFAAGFFLATALAGAGGAEDAGEGACAEAALTRNDSKQARTTRVMRSRWIAVVCLINWRRLPLQAAQKPKNYGLPARFQR